MFLLFDCNNFFASCEQVFRPDWRRRPLVVLSNNDGCVISRSPEAKAMGIAMGEPYFKCRDRLQQARAVVCSANFPLYSDLSDRIMGILDEALPDVRQYSIDEAFSVVGNGEWEPFCRKLRARIARWTGVTVSVGIAPTRTLCKLANETAKKDPSCCGVLALETPEAWQPLLAATPVDDVWGVGRRLAPRLHGFGLRTAEDLAGASLDWLRQRFGVHGERLALELRGVSCLDDDMPSPRSQIMVTRSLKDGVNDMGTLRQALCRFAEKAGRILRAEGMVASKILVLLRTSRYETGTGLYAAEREDSFPRPTDDTRILTRHAAALLEKLYKPGFNYKKIGMLLAGLERLENVQPTFEHPHVKPDRLMAALDSLQKSGFNIHFANQGKEAPWKREFESRHYTTDWKDIPEAR